MNVNRLFINLSDPIIFQSFGGEEFWSKVNAPAGTVVFKEGEDSQDFYYVFAGALVVDKSIKDQANTQKRIATLGQGDFFGEGALLSDKLRSATITTIGDTTLLKLSRKSFEALVVKDPHAAIGILLGIVKVLNARFQETNERLVLLQHVAQLVRDSNGSAEMALKTIVRELQTVTASGKALVLGLDASYKAATEGLAMEELSAIQTAFQKVLPLLQGEKPASSYIDGAYLFAPVRGVSGALTAVLVTQVTSESMEADTHIVLTVAEQLGHLL